MTFQFNLLISYNEMNITNMCRVFFLVQPARDDIRKIKEIEKQSDHRPTDKVITVSKNKVVLSNMVINC